jgi:hypothetical protein
MTLDHPPARSIPPPSIQATVLSLEAPLSLTSRPDTAAYTIRDPLSNIPTRMMHTQAAPSLGPSMPYDQGQTPTYPQMAADQ